MKKTVVAACLIANLLTPAWAQESSNDLKAVLEALQSIENRLTALEAAKGNGEASTPAPAAAAVAEGVPAAVPANTPPAGMVARSGWLLSALPFVENNPEPDALLVFPAGYRVSFADHERYDGSNTWYRYMGQGKLNVYEGGRHGFTVNFDSPNYTECWGYLSVDGSDVVLVGDNNDSASVNGGATATFSGFTDLDVGSYDLKFRLSCTPNGYNPKYSYDTSDLDRWKGINFEIKHKAPSDMAPRSLQPNEVFYFARADQPQAAPSSVPQAGGIDRQLQPGEEIVVVAAVNVRANASVDAPIIAQLAAGREMVMTNGTVGIDWLQLTTGEGAGGFVKVSALLTNSRLK